MSCDRRPLTAAVLLAPMFAAAACTPVDQGLGEAVKYNMAAQTINPDPVYGPDATPPGYHGERAQRAVDRYRKGQVTPVDTITTTSGAGGGGAGGGGGSGPR